MPIVTQLQQQRTNIIFHIISVSEDNRCQLHGKKYVTCSKAIFLCALTSYKGYTAY